MGSELTKDCDKVVGSNLSSSRCGAESRDTIDKVVRSNSASFGTSSLELQIQRLNFATLIRCSKGERRRPNATGIWI